MKKTWIYTCALLLAATAVSVPSLSTVAAPQPAISVTADQLQYDGKTQVATAKGNVVIVRDNATMTGATAMYNFEDGRSRFGRRRYGGTAGYACNGAEITFDE